MIQSNDPGEHRHAESERFRETAEGETRQADAAPDHRSDELVRTIDVKQTRCAAKRNVAHEKPHRLQPARAKQRDELISRDEKRDEVNASERALKAQPAQPEFGREMHSRTPILT